uniref:Uncharacterized protein n=1 Tax=Varanus komodoensis TaxID=61221 RepID=A0A8D2JG53_VARKO
PEGDAPVDSTDPSALPASSPPSLCPPFHCTQDDQTVTLLLQVPDIISQSFQGEVGAHHYRTTFSSKSSGAYECCFQFLPENKLSAPEIGVNVSPSNAVITLAKLPKSSGLWTKLYFGPNVNALQERWFVTENNVDAFLLRTSCSIQPEMECQPLLEVLDVSEGKSQIRLKVKCCLNTHV